MIVSLTKAGVLLGGLVALGSGPGIIDHKPQVKPKPVKVTGCLQKGDEENEFVITDKAGKKYEIISKSVALADHVGHTVTVKGTTVAEEKVENEAKEEKNEKGEKEEANEGEHVQVTSLAMVSPKCQ
jgi:hypothetical protein